MAKQKALVIAGRSTSQNRLLSALRSTGYRVVKVASGKEGVRRAPSLRPDLVLLEAELPGTDPLSILREIRGQLPDQRPPAFLFSGQSARAVDTAYAESGAGNNGGETEKRGKSDETPDELERAASAGELVSSQGLEIDPRRFRVTIDGSEMELTATEFRLLWVLASQQGYVLTRRELTAQCMGSRADVKHRTIDAHIKSIRQKLNDRGDLIETVRGVGYRFRDERTSA
jgi:two-component system phosphate regulon response regulator PhoB